MAVDRFAERPPRFAERFVHQRVESGGGSPAPSVMYWVNMRATALGPTGFVGDGENSTYSLGEAYPVAGRTIGDYSFGWGGDATAAAEEFPSQADFEHQAGVISMTAAIPSRVFQIVGVTPGSSYSLHVCQGYVAFGPFTIGFQISADADGENILYTQEGTVVPEGQFIDAQGNLWADADDWLLNAVPVTVEATSDSFFFAKNTVSGNNAYLTAIGIQDLTA